LIGFVKLALELLPYSPMGEIMKKAAMIFSAFLFLVLASPRMELFAFDLPDPKTSTSLQLNQNLQKKIGPTLPLLRLPSCTSRTRGFSDYEASLALPPPPPSGFLSPLPIQSLSPLTWYWSSILEEGGDLGPDLQDPIANPQVLVRSFSDLGGVEGKFTVHSPGTSINCSLITAQARFKVTIADSTTNAGDPWQSVAMSSEPQTDPTFCRFHYSIPVDAVGGLIEGLDGSAGPTEGPAGGGSAGGGTTGASTTTNSAYNLAVSLSAVPLSIPATDYTCTTWHQKYYIRIDVLPGTLGSYFFRASPWNTPEFGPDPATR
jgi:hypothetical protein